MLKKILALLLFSSLVVCASAESLLGGKLSLDIPAKFQKLEKSVLKTKFPGPNAPKVAYGNDSASVTIALNSRPVKLKMSQLPEFKQAMRKGIEAARPGVKFEADDILTIQGRKWAHFVFLSQATDGRIRNEMLISPKSGTVYMVNVNATTTDYPTYSKALQKAIRSLKIK